VVSEADQILILGELYIQPLKGTVFTCLNATVTFHLIDAATIQGQPLIKGSVYSIKQLLSAATIQ